MGRPWGLPASALRELQAQGRSRHGPAPRERLRALLRPGLPGCRTGAHPRADRAARPAPVPHGAVAGGLRGAGLAQARWRPQGDECARGPAAHAARRPADPAAAVAHRAATANRWRCPRAPLRPASRPCPSRSPKPAPCASPCCAPPIPAAASGTNSSSATTTSATSPCPAPNCATSCTPPTASCWPCSAAAPRPGKPPRATVSSAGMPPPASATCRCSSITPAISSCRRWLHNPTLATSLKNKDFLIRVPRQRTLSRPLSIPCHANPRLDPGNRTLAGHPDSILPTTLPS